VGGPFTKKEERGRRRIMGPEAYNGGELALVKHIFNELLNSSFPSE